MSLFPQRKVQKKCAGVQAGTPYFFQTSWRPSSRCLFSPPPCQSRACSRQLHPIAAGSTCCHRRRRRPGNFDRAQTEATAPPPATHNPKPVVNIYASCHFVFLRQLLCVRAVCGGGWRGGGVVGGERWRYSILRKQGGEGGVKGIRREREMGMGV